MKESSRIDQNRVSYNTLLINGYNSYQNRDLKKALLFYQEAEELSTRILISSPLVKSIMGVIHMHNCNYMEAIGCFDAGLRQLKTTQFKKSSSFNLDYQIAAVTIKLHANLSLCYLILGQYRQSIQNLQSCMKILNQASDQNVKNLYESLVYIFFRFNNFSVMRNADFDSLQMKYDDYSQGCFYSTMGINKQLCDNPQQAYNFQKKALQIWTSRKESGFMLVTTQHLLNLAKQLNLGRKTISEYEKLIYDLTNSPQLQGINEKVLFKGFNQKMKCAKNITQILLQFQKDQLKYRDVQQIQLKDWKLATRLRLLRAIRSAEAKIKTVDSKSRKQLQLAIEQMKQTLISLQSEQNSLVQKNLQRSNFVKQAVNNFNGLKSLVVKTNHIYSSNQKLFKKYVLKVLQSNVLQPLKKIQKVNENVTSVLGKNKRQNYGYTNILPANILDSNRKEENESKNKNTLKQQDSSINRKKNSNNSQYVSVNISQITNFDEKIKKKILKYFHLCEQGQYFVKRNYGNDSGEQKWVMLTKTEFRWASDQSKINKKGQYQSYPLKDVRGIIYGKQSDTFMKACNKSYVPWRCFSIVLNKRTFDLYAQSDQDITIWIPGFSHAIKRQNPQNKSIIGYNPGRLLWKKMWLILTHHFIDPYKKKQKATYYFARAEAVRRFANNGFKLPPKKK